MDGDEGSSTMMILFPLILLLLGSTSGGPLLIIAVPLRRGSSKTNLVATKLVSPAAMADDTGSSGSAREREGPEFSQHRRPRPTWTSSVPFAKKKLTRSAILMNASKVTGGGRGGVRSGKASRERDEERLETIRSISQIMLLLAWQGLSFGFIKLAIGLAHIGFKRKPRRVIVSDAFSLMGQLAELYIAMLLRDGGLAFGQIVDRKKAEDATGIGDDDVDNVMIGLEAFQKIMKKKMKPTAVYGLATFAALLSFFSLLPEGLHDKVYEKVYNMM